MTIYLTNLKTNVFALIFLVHIGGGLAQKSVIINELMIDPSPPVALPNGEFIELKNISDSNINLQNFSISDNSKTAYLPNFTLKKDSFVLITSTTNATQFQSFGQVLGVANFPSLNNDLDTVVLYNNKKEMIHFVAYNEAWFKNGIKTQGGWSIELIDPNYAFSGNSNWDYSIHEKGGSPCTKNSIEKQNFDTIPLEILSYKISNNNCLKILFNKSLSKKHILNNPVFSFKNNTIIIDSIKILAPIFSEVEIYVASVFEEKTIYELNIDALKDLDDKMHTPLSLKFGNASPISILSEIYINEILFDPLPFESSFIELYNNSNNIYDVNKLLLAKFDNNVFSSITALGNTPFYFYPNTFLVVTKNKKSFLEKYTDCQPSNIFESALPSFSNDSGTIVILNQASEIVDKITYNTKLHYPFLLHKEGVSLEKIYYTLDGTSTHSWFSGAYPKFCSPCQINTQFKNFNINTPSNFSVQPSLITPNNDGYNDFLTIAYTFAEPGNLLNINFFDKSGTLISTICSGALAGMQGNFIYSPTTLIHTQLATGYYIIGIEIIKPNGETVFEKIPVYIIL